MGKAESDDKCGLASRLGASQTVMEKKIVRSIDVKPLENINESKYGKIYLLTYTSGDNTTKSYQVFTDQRTVDLIDDDTDNIDWSYPYRYDSPHQDSDQERLHGTNYSYLTDRAYNYHFADFGSDQFELVSESEYMSSIAIEPEEVLKLDSFDPDRLMIYNVFQNGEIWRPNKTDAPVTYTRQLEIWGTHYDLDKVKEKLDSNPAVASAEIETNPVWQNHGISGTRLLQVHYRLPQEEYEKFYKNFSPSGGHSAFQSSLEEHLFVAPGRYDKPYAFDLSSEECDYFGIGEFAYQELKDSADYRDDEDDNSWY